MYSGWSSDCTIKSDFAIFLGCSYFGAGVEKSLKSVDLTDQYVTIGFHLRQLLPQASASAETRTGSRREIVRCERNRTSMAAQMPVA